MSIDPGALARLRVRIEEVLGMDDTAALLDPLARVPWDRLATVDDLERFATKDDLRAFATKEDLERFPTREEVAAEVQQAELRLRELFERRLAEHQSQIRRDLLLVTGGQFFALVAAVAAVLGLG